MFERVEAGMTRAELEATVGGPAGRYSERTCYCMFEEGCYVEFADDQGWRSTDGGRSGGRTTEPCS